MLTQAVDRRAEFVRSVLRCAAAFLAESRLDRAEALLATVAADTAVKPMVLHLRGLIAMRQGEKERARQLLEASIAADPTDAEAHANLGALMYECGVDSRAAAAYEAALTLKPQVAASHFGLAKALLQLGQLDLAADSFRDALACAPHYVEAAVDLAMLLDDLGDHAEALTLLRDALTRHPERPELHTALAFCLLGAGEWEAAWPEYEWRLSDPRPAAGKTVLPADRPRWRGEDLAGRSILLCGEQGFGDTLQFARFAPLVAARGGRVVLCAPPSLLGLLRSLPGVHAFAATVAPFPPTDVHAPLLSLPGIFATRPQSVPDEVPYLRANADLARRWGERLGSHGGLSVGLCWQGNPAHANDRQRSLPLAALRPLLDCPGGRFVSLQVGPGEDQLKGFDGRIIDAASAMARDSFADAAAVIVNLDLVICIDSAVAHLAGALGKPVWILLAAFSDWRWLRGRDDTPWYPQARLFRQRHSGEWDAVVERVKAALWALADADGTGLEAVSPAPAPRRPPEPGLADALFVAGCRHHAAGDVMRSKKLFERVLSLDPDHVHALCNLGAVEKGRGHLERAATLLDRAVARAPALVPPRLTLVETELSAGRPDAALVHAREAVRLAPRSDAAHAALAMVLQAAGDADAAMVHFEQAVRIDQRQSPQFYAVLARALVARGNLSGAEVSLQHARALDSQLAAAHD